MNLPKRLKLALGSGIVILTILTLGAGQTALGGAATAPITPTITNVDKVQGFTESPEGIAVVIRGIVRWVYILFFILAVLFILMAAFRYLTAAGDQEKVNKAKDALIYAAVAIAIALVAISMSTIIQSFLRDPSTGS